MNAYEHNKYFGEKWAQAACDNDAKIFFQLSSSGDGKLIVAAHPDVQPAELIKCIQAALDGIATSSGQRMIIKPR